MPKQSASHRVNKPLAVTLILMITVPPIAIINFEDVNADECGPDADWSEKPCPAYGAGSEAELRERWDQYYETKGKDWMNAKKTEMDQAIKDGTFTEWIKNAPDNNFANRNAYFYYRLNDQAPLMVYDPPSGRYFMPEAQDPSVYSYSALSGDYYPAVPSESWYAQSETIYLVIGVGSAAAVASIYAFWKVKRR